MTLAKFRSAIGKVSDAFNYVGLAALFVMVFVVAIDVILRKISGNSIIEKALSIKGSNELTVYLMVYACVLGIPVLERDRGHVWVNLLVNRFPSRLRSFWLFIILLVETAIIAMLCWGAFRNVLNLFNSHKETMVLEMPQWIFAAATIVAFIEYFLLSLCGMLSRLFDGIKGTISPENE